MVDSVSMPDHLDGADSKHKTKQGVTTVDSLLNNNHKLDVREILSEVHKVGKHFVDHQKLQQLSVYRDELIRSSASDWTLTFLNVILDKFDDTYDYRSYLALDLLSWQNCTKNSSEYIDWQLTIISADLIRFELESLRNHSSWLYKMTPDQQLVNMRCRRLIKCMANVYKRTNVLWDNNEQDAIIICDTICSAVSSRLSENEKLRLKYSMIPVYINHDEYIFLRILQAFETLFDWLASCLMEVISLAKSDLKQASELLSLSANRLNEMTALFPLLSTLRVDAFREFRNYTEGASAIQSRNYKKVESLCRKPDAERINSIAYQSVPEVRETVLRNPETINDVFSHIPQDNLFKDDFHKAMTFFESGIKTWRQSHYGIAVKMLGHSPSNGYTEGTPYLKEVRKIPVFKKYLNKVNHDSVK
ncbi:hypothetical protein [Photobacterium leiognathi]|uniref:hypothetical protein n=1 Tax=Photobacterium leiognathi TaxID=553611 RepID=UPI002739EFD8|nr:hypothetical protein [Photobacterium leiognathi]